MKFDFEEAALRFGTADEADRFHNELTVLLRTVMRAQSASVAEAHDAVDLSREVFREYRTVTRVLNAMRRGDDRARRKGPVSE